MREKIASIASAGRVTKIEKKMKRLNRGFLVTQGICLRGNK